jgi:hypothetical protein
MDFGGSARIPMNIQRRGLMRLLTVVSALLMSACSHQKPELDLTPTPYTSIARIALVTEQSAEGETIIPFHLGISQSATVIVRDKANGKVFSFPIRANTIRAQLGQGGFQILGIEFSRNYQGVVGSVSGIFVGSRTYDQSVEGRAEFEVQRGDLGKEIDFGTYNPVTGEVTGGRLKSVD